MMCLETHRALQDEEKVSWKEDQGPVFRICMVGPDKTPRLSGGSPEEGSKEAQSARGQIPRPEAHLCDLLLLEDGVHPKIVQKTLGHATVTVTLDTYSHVLLNVRRRLRRRWSISSIETSLYSSPMSV